MSRKITVGFTQEIFKEVTVTIPDHVASEDAEQYAIDEGSERLPLDVEADGEWESIGVRYDS